MLSWLSNPELLLAGVILAGIQFIAALPWLYTVDPASFRRFGSSIVPWGYVAAGLLAAGVGFAIFLGYKSSSANLGQYGHYGYGAILHLQLIVDLFLIMPEVVAFIWPKGGAVAYAAFREGWRQPMFWLITGFGLLCLAVAIIVPYFTFNDDYKMMKQIGFDIIMLAPALFGVLAASMSIAEEIEGRTAITLMSKPVNRRQFLLGKFLGTLMACLVMSLVLGWFFNFASRAVREFDRINNDPDPRLQDYKSFEFGKVLDPMTISTQRWTVPAFERVVPTTAGKAIAHGAGEWFGDTAAHGLGIALGFGQVMILVAIASALATRLPYAANLVICLMIYLLGHLAPAIVRAAEMSGRGTGGELVGFLGRLFDMLLPALDFFNMGPAIIRDSPLHLGQFAIYVVTVFGYSLIYTAIALLVGLLLFEDRDLA